MNESMYLTDRMYLQILIAARRIIDTSGAIVAVDDTTMGCKSTACNIGLCNDAGLCTAHNAMWPEQFPARKALRYRKGWHACPLDSRKAPRRNSNVSASGCFYTCRVFNGKLRGKKGIETAKQLYDERIAEVQTWFDDGGSGLFMALQSDEVAAVAICGCRLVIDRDTGCPHFYMCDMHADAERLRADALETLTALKGAATRVHADKMAPALARIRDIIDAGIGKIRMGR